MEKLQDELEVGRGCEPFSLGSVKPGAGKVGKCGPVVSR